MPNDYRVLRDLSDWMPKLKIDWICAQLTALNLAQTQLFEPLFEPLFWYPVRDISAI